VCVGTKKINQSAYLEWFVGVRELFFLSLDFRQTAVKELTEWESYRNREKHQGKENSSYIQIDV